MTLKDDLTILLCTCDKYEDIWPLFFHFFEKYWPDCPCEIVLNTESKSFSHEKYNIKSYNLYSSDSIVSYGKRMIDHLDKIKTKYVLILLDDFFIRKPVDAKKLLTILNWLEDDETIACFNFDSLRNKAVDDGKYPGFLLMPEFGEYKYNLQSAIWNKDTFRKAWRENESPWDWELYGNCRSFNCDNKFYTLDAFDNSPIYYAQDKDCRAIIQGKWVLADIEPLFEKEKLDMDFSIRGTYDKNSNINKKRIEAIKGAFKNIPFKYAMTWLYCVTINRISQTLFKKKIYHDYTDLICK